MLKKNMARYGAAISSTFFVFSLILKGMLKLRSLGHWYILFKNASALGLLLKNHHQILEGYGILIQNRDP